MKLEKKISNFPQNPGVYLFKDSQGEIIYVGKAKSLRKRVKSYFKDKKTKGSKIQFLLRRAKDIDFIINLHLNSALKCCDR